MLAPATRTRFQDIAAVGAGSAHVRDLARRLHAPTASADDRLELAAIFAHAAFAAPDRIAHVYDATAEGWLGETIDGPTVATLDEPPVSIDPAFWDAFWTLVGATGFDAAEITARTAALGAFAGEGLRQRAARAALTYPGVAEAAAQGYPPKMTMEALAACQDGSLGHEFHRLIVDNGFDLEVLDRDALGLSGLMPPLDYLNARILQCHDLWHIVGGYRTTAQHEVAISAFQLAQFGHGYSAMFLTVAATGAAARDPGAFSLIMDTILTAWRHGRRTPPMIGIPWQAVWNQTTAAIRERFGVEPYVSPYPADLFETFRAA